MYLVKSFTIWTLYFYSVNILICTVVLLNKDLEYNKLKNAKDFLSKLEDDELNVITENSILHKLFDVIDKLDDSSVIQIINKVLDNNSNLKDQTYHVIYKFFKKILFLTIVEKQSHIDLRLKVFDEIYFEEPNDKMKQFFPIDKFLKGYFDEYCCLRNSKFYQKERMYCKRNHIEDIISMFIIKIIVMFSKNIDKYQEHLNMTEKIIYNMKKKDSYENTINYLKDHLKDSTNNIYLTIFEFDYIEFLEKKYNEEKVSNENRCNSREEYSVKLTRFIYNLDLVFIERKMDFLYSLCYKNEYIRLFFKWIIKALKEEIFKPQFYKDFIQIIFFEPLDFFLSSILDFCEVKFLEKFISDFDSCYKKYIRKNMHYRTNFSIELNSSNENVSSENQKIYIFKNILLSTLFTSLMEQIKSNTAKYNKIFDIKNFIKIKKEDKKLEIECFMNEIDGTNIIEKNLKCKNFYFIYEIINILSIDNNKKIILEDKHKFYEDLRSEIETAIQETIKKSIKNNIKIQNRKIYVDRFLKSFFRNISIKKILDKNKFFICEDIEEELEKNRACYSHFRNFDDFDEKEFFIKSKEICDFLYFKNLYLKENIQKKQNENFKKWRKEHIQVYKIDETQSNGNDQNFVKKEQDKSVRTENLESKILENLPSLKECTSTSIQDSKEKNVSKCSEKIMNTKIDENERKKLKVKTRSKLPGNFIGNLKQEDCQNKISNDKKLKVQTIENKQQKTKQPKKSQINSKLLKKKKAQELIENSEFLELVKITREHIKSEDKQEKITVEKNTKEKKTKSKGKNDKLKSSKILKNFLEFKTSKEEDNINSITENIQEFTITKEDYEENYPPIYKEQKNQKKTR